MFTSDVRETLTQQVALHDMDTEAVVTIIQYMYTAVINIDNSNVQNIFTAASLFEMLGLCELCANHMKKELHISNCVGVYAFGSYHSWEALKQASRNFLVDRFLQVCMSEEFQQLSFEDFSEVIADDNLNVQKEETVFEAIERWVECDLDSRQHYLGQLFRHLRLPLLTQEFIRRKVLANQLVGEDTSCQTLLADAQIGTETLAKPRLGMYNRKLMVFVGGSQDRHVRALTCYDPLTKENYYAIPLHVSFDFKYRIDHHRATVTDKSDIYLVGGIFYEEHHFEETGSALNEVKVFDAYCVTWRSRAPLLAARCAHVLLHHQGKIYALGGKSTYPRGAPLASCEVYDPENDLWAFVSAMPLGLCHHNGVCHNDTFYLAGGMTDNDDVTNVFLQYDVQTDMWAVLTDSMQIPRAEFGMVLLDDKIYTIGGTDGNIKLSTVEVYHLSTRQWFYGPDFPEDRKSMVAVAYDGRIYVCGGVRTLISRVNRAPRVVETKELHSFDPTTGLWSKEAKLVQYANIHACVVTELNTKRLHKSDFISSA